MGDNEFDAFSSMSGEFNTKIADIEGKYELLRERMLLSNESFIKNRDNILKEMRIIKEDVREIKTEIEKLKEIMQHMSADSEEYARKEELRILERYMKLWEPLKFTRVDEVKRMIQEALAGLKSEHEEVKV
ncbi:MAG: hypothetical protein V1660_01850 [archaeon]